MEENKMGVMPVNKLLISMALPMMISMLVQALYNIVDSMFVAQISENALTAVSLAFPAQNLMIAIGTGTGVGINALVSRSLGERNQERANLIANNGLALYVISGILFAIFGLLGSNLFFRAQTDDPEIVRLGTEYLRICCLLSTAIFLQFGFERILQATGRTFYTMLTQGLGAIVNIIMDPILIFGLFGAHQSLGCVVRLSQLCSGRFVRHLWRAFSIKRKTMILSSIQRNIICRHTQSRAFMPSGFLPSAWHPSALL